VCDERDLLPLGWILLCCVKGFGGRRLRWDRGLVIRSRGRWVKFVYNLQYPIHLLGNFISQLSRALSKSIKNNICLKYRNI